MDGKFCKLYETEELGQILVKLDRGESDKPEVRYYSEPEGLGVCSTAHCFPDTEDGWNRAEQMFASVEEPAAVLMAKALTNLLDDDTEEGEKGEARNP